MRRNPTILSLFVSALAMPGVANAAIEPETKVALDTLWVLVAAFLVFCLVILGERRLRNARDRALSREELHRLRCIVTGVLARSAHGSHLV